jgi:hypothetical protein
VNATARFYTGFAVVLALVVALAFFAGYRAGVATHGAHRTTSASAR